MEAELVGARAAAGAGPRGCRGLRARPSRERAGCLGRAARPRGGCVCSRGAPPLRRGSGPTGQLRRRRGLLVAPPSRKSRYGGAPRRRDDRDRAVCSRPRLWRRRRMMRGERVSHAKPGPGKGQHGKRSRGHAHSALHVRCPGVRVRASAMLRLTSGQSHPFLAGCRPLVAVRVPRLRVQPWSPPSLRSPRIHPRLPS